MSWKCAEGPRGENVHVQTYPNRASSGRAAFPVLTNDHLLPLELKLCLPVPLDAAVLDLHPAALKVVRLGWWNKDGWTSKRVVTHSIRNEREGYSGSERVTGR